MNSQGKAVKRLSRARRIEQSVLALLQHGTTEKAAAALSISDVTLWRLQQEDDFQEAYNKARREAYSKAVSRLQHASQAAVATLLSVMADRTAPPACRVRAADSILDRSHRGIELEDLEFRLQKLEKLDPRRKN